MHLNLLTDIMRHNEMEKYNIKNKSTHKNFQIHITIIENALHITITKNCVTMK